MRTVNTITRKSTTYRGRGKRQQRNRAGRIFGGMTAVVLILICSFGFGSFFSSAHGNAQEEPVDYKYYKSIEIEEGDSIWSIAEAYMGTEYDSVYDYIAELASINNLDADSLDEIREGDYLMIAYYDTRYN